jgi:NADH:ubiquinone oxidoreductase subunit 5 (subunit L)/multisubunit Na+/H+ antiporter MnhA subunit
MVEQIVWLIPALHWLAALWIGVGYLLGMNRGETGESHTAGSASLAALVSTLLATTLGISALWQGAPGPVSHGTWFSSGAYAFSIEFALDPLGLSLLILVSLISLLTIRFSANYMHREAGFQRFFLLLSLFAGAMELIVVAGNSLLLFVAWELAGVSSFLLIGYAIERQTATRNAVRAFVTNRVGDAGFILGIALSLFWLHGLDWSTMTAQAGEIGTLPAGVIASAFLLAALAKSAQFPFAPWIARALEGPTPSSAIFYGALMVHAGVVLLIRLEPLLLQAPAMMLLIALLGGLTVLYGWLSGLLQSDVKNSLMFATTTQVGWMFVWCGLGWFTLAAWHLGLHAIWRAFQFLSAPALMHLVAQETRPLPGWLTRRPWLYQAALQRFYLDPLSDTLLVRPTLSLARDVQYFDEQGVTRMVGLPIYTRSVSSLAQWEAMKQEGAQQETGSVGTATGAAGRLMTWLANQLYWFESRLVLSGGGEGLLKNLHRVGALLMQAEQLLSQPRYLIVLILVTIVVIL